MNGRRRIAIVVSHPIQYYVPLYRELAKSADLDIKVFFASRFGLEKSYDPEMKVEVAWATDLIGGYPHEFLPEADRIQSISFNAVDNPSVAAALARFRPDAVIIHGYAMKTMLRALAWSRWRGVRTVMASDSSAHAARRGWRRAVKMAIVPYLLRRFDAILTMGDRAEAHLESLRYPRSRMFRLPMMIDEAFWRAREATPEARAAARAALGFSAQDFVALAVGKLHPRKRMFDLLAAFRALKARPGVRRPCLAIAGDGEEREALQRYATEHGLDVVFVGFVNIDRLPALYRAADVFVHTPEIEQYGMVVLEAAVVGLPMILSDSVGAVGPASIARAGLNALVYPSGDVAALADAVAALRDDVEAQARMASASLQISLEHRGPQSVANVKMACGQGAPT